MKTRTIQIDQNQDEGKAKELQDRLQAKQAELEDRQRREENH